MKIREHGTNSLVFPEVTRPLIDMRRELPGRARFKDGQLFVENSGGNIEVMLKHFPVLSEAGIKCIDEFLGVVEQLEENLAVPAEELPLEASFFNFKTKPYEHQRHAFAKARNQKFFGLLMEMGTGKTKVLIDNAFSLYAQGLIDTVIVLAPNGVHTQWVDQQIPLHACEDHEFRSFAYFSGMGKKATEALQEVEDWKGGLRFFAMATPSLASKKAQEKILEWMNGNKVMLVLDESQMFKNPSAARTKFVLKISEWADYRRIATGTVVTQGLEDLYTQLKFLHPQILGHNSYYTFRNEYCRLVQIPGAPAGAFRIVGYKNVDKLQRAIASSTFQVKKIDCLDLPEKIKMTRHVTLSDEQERAYKQMKKHMVAELSDGGVVSAPIALTMLMKLQQIVSGHLIDEEGNVHKLKSNRVQSILDILEEQKKAIVWCRFRQDIEDVAEALEAEGYRVGKYYGETSSEERERIVKPDEVDVLVANAASAGTGLNLTHFKCAIYFSNSFNAGERWQSEDRIHRIGQEHDCLYIDLVAPGTVDEKLVAALSFKKEIADTVTKRPGKMLAEELEINFEEVF